MSKFIVTMFDKDDSLVIEADCYATESDGFVFYLEDDKKNLVQKYYISKKAVLMIEKRD